MGQALHGVCLKSDPSFKATSLAPGSTESLYKCLPGAVFVSSQTPENPSCIAAIHVIECEPPVVRTNHVTVSRGTRVLKTRSPLMIMNNMRLAATHFKTEVIII